MPGLCCVWCFQVIQVYIIDYTRACITDLRSRPLHKSIHKYITGEENPGTALQASFERYSSPNGMAL
jgi:hypothetical protein